MKKKTILTTLVLFVLLCILLSWFFYPLMGMKLFYWSYDEGDTFTLEDYRKMYHKQPNDYQLIRDDFFYPSDEITDYCTIVVGSQAWNMSPFTVTQIELTVDWKDPDSDVILVEPSLVSTAYCECFSKMEYRFITSFFVYRNGKTDEEIVEYLKNAEVRLTYNTSIKSYSKRMKLGDFSYQVMEHFEDLPKGWEVPAEEVLEEGFIYVE